MTSFPGVSLPEEILGHIVQSFDPLCADEISHGDNLAALARISRASKQLQRLAEPLLYNTFFGNRDINAVSWLKSVLARPDRAQKVRSLIVRHSKKRRPIGKASRVHDSASSSSSNDEGCYDEDAPLLKRLIDNADLRYDGDTTRQLLRDELDKEGASQDLVLSVITLLCTSISEIDIELCDEFYGTLLRTVLTSQEGDIRHVSLHHRFKLEIEFSSIDLFVDMIARRNVETLELTGDILDALAMIGLSDAAPIPDVERHDQPHYQVDLPTWPNIKRICLSDCDMGPDSYPCPIGWLLRVCPALNSLELKSKVGWRLQSLHIKGDSIRKYGSGLQDLVIDSGSCWYDREDELEWIFRNSGGLSGVGGLQALVNLKCLVVTPWTLLGPPRSSSMDDEPTTSIGRHFVDLLPPTLQSLMLLPCVGRLLQVDIGEEIRLLRQDPRFANLKIYVKEVDDGLDAGWESDTDDSQTEEMDLELD